MPLAFQRAVGGRPLPLQRAEPAGLDAQLPVAARRDRAVVGHQHSVVPASRFSSNISSITRLAGGEVEAAGRLVGQQHRGPHDEGARQRDALLLAARQHARIVAQPLAQADPLQHLGGQRARVVAAQQLERQHHVLQRVQVAEQLEALEHEAQLVARAPRRAASSSSANRSMPARRTVPELGVSKPATIDSSVLLPDPEAPTMATDSRALQGEIDVVENRQRAGRSRGRVW